MNFKECFNENLKDSTQDIANNGADAGYPHITYYSDTTELFDKFEGDILAMLSDCTESIGYTSNIELIKTFNKQDMLEGFYETLRHDDTSKCLLVWFACEELSHQLDSEVA